jgi:hypothetical protein
MSIFKDIIKKQIEERKTFSYSKNNVNLAFTLRVDIKKDMIDFRALLDGAISDIDEIIKKK